MTPHHPVCVGQAVEKRRLPSTLKSLFSPRHVCVGARGRAGWHDLPCSPLARLILSMSICQPDDLAALRRFLGPKACAPFSVWTWICRRTTARSGIHLVPTCRGGRLTPGSRNRLPEWGGGGITWPGRAPPRTKRRCVFLKVGLWLATLAIGRRLYVHTPGGSGCFPISHHVGGGLDLLPQSAGLNLAHDLARGPSALILQPGSPEAFMSMLGGLPPSFDDPPRPRAAGKEQPLRRSAAFADELSALFKSFGRDYMSGMKELLMQLYDCPDYLDSNTNNRGLVVIRDAALSILGAATPAELSVSLSHNDWHNGTLARFVLLTPEPDYAERIAARDTTMPQDLVRLLRQLHEMLPAPPEPQALGDEQLAIEPWSLVATEIWEPLHIYERVLREMTAPDAPLDDRLRTVYGRLHIQALKVAIILAALDWIELGERKPNKPIVRAAHWYRARQIVETWRASAHRLLHDLGESEEARLEMRILKLLASHANGLSVRDIYRALRSPRKPVIEVLKALEQDGQVVPEVVQNGGRGRPSECYRLI